MEKIKINKNEVAYVAHLARLSFNDVEQERLTSQLNDILLYMEALNELDTTDVAPMTHAIVQKNAFRDDEVRDSLSPDEALANAPEMRNGCFKVPRVIE